MELSRVVYRICRMDTANFRLSPADYSHAPWHRSAERERYRVECAAIVIYCGTVALADGTR